MDPKPLTLKMLPIDVSTPAPAAAAPQAASSPGTLPQLVMPDMLPPPADPAKPVDRFLVEATHQFKEGHIDQPLWTRALEQADGDKERATEAYLRARATSLRLIDRELRAKHRSLATPSSPVAVRAVDAEPVVAANRSRRGRARPWHRYAAAAGTTLIVAVVGVFALDAYRQGQVPVVPSPSMAMPRPASLTPKTPRPAGPPEVATPVPQNSPTKEFLAKVQALRDASNWNVLVLYAAEWTRKEPGNALAWNELSLGYANLHQYADARDAATAALKINPTDSRYWRTLAQLELDLDEPAEALRAFDRAAALDDQDSYSMVQSGVLNMKLGYPTEAKVAFDKALALRPDDGDALCLKALLASRQNAPKGKPSGAEAVTGKCRDTADTPRVTVVAGEGTATRPAPAQRR